MKPWVLTCCLLLGACGHRFPEVPENLPRPGLARTYVSPEQANYPNIRTQARRTAPQKGLDSCWLNERRKERWTIC